MSPGFLHVSGGVPIRERGPVYKVHRHSLQVWTGATHLPSFQEILPSDSCRHTTGAQSPPTTGKLCYITSYIATSPLRSIQVTLRSVSLNYVSYVTSTASPGMFRYFHYPHKRHISSQSMSTYISRRRPSTVQSSARSHARLWRLH